jgi:hypothetical protein
MQGTREKLKQIQRGKLKEKILGRPKCACADNMKVYTPEHEHEKEQCKERKKGLEFLSVV